MDTTQTNFVSLPDELIKTIISFRGAVTQNDKIKGSILEADNYQGNDKTEYIDYLINIINDIFNSEENIDYVDRLMLPFDNHFERWDMLWYVQNGLDEFGVEEEEKYKLLCKYKCYNNLSRTYAFFKAHEILHELVELKYP